MIYKLYIAGYGKIPNAVMATNTDGSGFSFLLGTNNPEEQAYLKWLENGGIPLPAENI